MPRILNIESATDICSVCLSQDGELLVAKSTDKAYSHSNMLTLLIQQCCAETEITLGQLDAIAISKGPGSYTSLRVGASVAKGICYALDKPMIAIDTLQSLALATIQKEGLDALYSPMIDARRMEVYTALYGKNMNVIEGIQAKIIDRDSFSGYFDQDMTIVFSGNGAPKCNNALTAERAVFSNVVCSATHLIPLSTQAFKERDFCDIAYFSPTYFKPPNITTPRKTL